MKTKDGMVRIPWKYLNCWADINTHPEYSREEFMAYKQAVSDILRRWE